MFWEKFLSRGRDRPLHRGEEPLLSSGWTLITSELSSPNFNSSVRAERSFAIRYLNVVIKSLGGNPDTVGRGILFPCFSRGERCFLIALFGSGIVRYSRFHD